MGFREHIVKIGHWIMLLSDHPYWYFCEYNTICHKLSVYDSTTKKKKKKKTNKKKEKKRNQNRAQATHLAVNSILSTFVYCKHVMIFFSLYFVWSDQYAPNYGI